MNKLIIQITFFLLLPVLCIGGNNNGLSRFVAALDNIKPRQKVYLHLDKDEYYAGDRIWYKAYVISAQDHKPDTLENTLYVEIISSDNQLLSRKTLFVEQGYAHGDLQLNDSVISGNYLLRAYTNWMLNFSEDFIFERQIFIHNPIEKKLIGRSEARNNRRVNKELERREEQYEFQFFPEGGSLSPGIENRVAFFASNRLGKGINIQGELKDSQGNHIVSFESLFNGKGVFTFIPEPDQGYVISVKFPTGRSRNFNMRNVRTEEFNLRVDNYAERVSVKINRSPILQNQQGENGHPYLVIHRRGAITEMVQLTNTSYPYILDISKSDLNPGVHVATLFSGNAGVLSERLFFVAPQKRPESEISLKRYSEDFYDLQIRLSEFVKDTAAYSVSVTASHRGGILNRQNILSNIYLSSDIVHPIQNPAEYIQGNMAIDYADLLMMATSWTRHSWQELLEFAEKEELKFEKDPGFSVYGNIKPTEHSRKIGRTNFEVTLMWGEESRTKITYTDEEGNFSFDGLEEFGEYDARITLVGLQGSTPEHIEMFPGHFDEESSNLDFESRRMVQRGTAGWRFRRSTRSPKSDRFIQLHDETKSPGYGNPDQTIYLRPEDARHKTMRDIIIRNVSGVMVEGYSIIIRGKSSVFYTNQPLIMVDGIQYNSRQFLQMPPIEISHIEVYKGSSAAIFGLRGANGALIAYTRRGQNPERIIFNYVLDGYYVPRSFSSEDARLRELFFADENYKQTIFWRPYLRPNNEGKSVLRLPIEEMPPFITVLLEGIDSNGQVYFIRKEFETASYLP